MTASWMIVSEGKAMDLSEIVTQRYNVKKFDGRKIDGQTLARLFDMIRYAPSANNLQPWKIKVISDPMILERLLSATLPFNRERLKTCSHLLVFCADRDLEAHWSRLQAEAKKAGLPDSEIQHMAGVTRMILGRPPGEQLNRSQRDVLLAVGNAVNGAFELGISSSLMGGFNAKEYSAILGLPENLEPTLIVALGYAADTPPPKVRFSVEDVFF